MDRVEARPRVRGMRRGGRVRRNTFRGAAGRKMKSASVLSLHREWGTKEKPERSKRVRGIHAAARPPDGAGPWKTGGPSR